MKRERARAVYHTIFDETAEGIYLVTPDGDFVAASPAFATLFGFESPEELASHISNPWAQLYCEPGQHKKLLRMLMKHASVTGFESKACRKNGDVFMISEDVRAVQGKNGSVIYYMGSVEDATQRKPNGDAFWEDEAHLRISLEQSERNRNILLDIIDEVCLSHSTMEHVFINTLTEIVNALDSRRWWTRERSRRVASHALKIAEEMGFHEDEKRLLHTGALLHDIGQSVFYDGLIDKPVKLTSDEVKLVRKHPEHGAAILNKSDELKDVVSFIRHHHERMDGRGYPDGLKGDEIPLGARIIHVATTYDSIVTDRPYRPAKDRDQALREIVRCTNTQFDSHVTEAALKVL